MLAREPTGATSVSIKASLTQDRAFRTEYLLRLDRTLAAIASMMQGFAPVAEAIRPEARRDAAQGCEIARDRA
jgi:hypothetical protein